MLKLVASSIPCVLCHHKALWQVKGKSKGGRAHLICQHWNSTKKDKGYN